MRPLFGYSLITALALTSACGDSDTNTEPVRFTISVENVSEVHDFPNSGVFNTPVGETSAGPLLPGDAYEFEFAAAPGTRLSFATMFVNSNDLFFAPAKEGLQLFDADGIALSGNVTSQIQLWDLGTEENQEPGSGSNQAMNQAGPNMGPDDPNTTIRMASDDFGNLPAVDEVIEATLTAGEANLFTLRIANVSVATTLQFTGGESGIVMTPGPWVVHAEDGPLFVDGEVDKGDGLEGLAEDGDPGALVQSVGARTGITGPIAPGAFAVHAQGSDALYSMGQPDRGLGLEALAEDGDSAALAASLEQDSTLLESGAFAIPAGASDPGPVFSGSRYEFAVTAEPGDYLSLATMFVQSNDLFLGFDPGGVALFDADGNPVSGDLSGSLKLWDAGTEANEFPGLGANQAPRQASSNTGPDESVAVGIVADGFTYPAADAFLKVTITPSP
tara:strand:- start:18157 stop:19494 length:1338 start_codon:yes stop_codon:yes gene_type:complete